MQKIVPCLWFDTQAKEAAEFYTTVFPDAKMLTDVTLPGTPSGDTNLVTFSIGGQEFMAMSAGPVFKLNPSISFMVNFDPSRSQTREGLEELWGKLADGGSILMPLQEYPFSKLYGWVQDKFGVSWQLMLTDPDGEPRPFIIPSLLFSGENINKAEDAMKFYLSVFKDAKQGTLARYPEQTGPARKDAIMFADVQLLGHWIAAMDSGVEQPFTFNEALSLVINCENQEEMDYYTDKMSAVPEAEQCGWIKDKFGVSWQITPDRMNDMLEEGTPAQIAAVTKAFLPMKRIDMATLEAAYQDAK